MKLTQITLLFIFTHMNLNAQYYQTPGAYTPDTEPKHRPWMSHYSSDPSLEKHITDKREKKQLRLAINKALLKILSLPYQVAKVPVSAFQTKKLDQYIADHPARIELISSRKEFFTPNPQTAPTWVNSYHEFKGILDREFGFCWGAATVLRKFLHLAFFDEKLEYPKADYKTINKQIRRLLRGKPEFFSGFKSFRDFNQDPRIEHLLKKFVANTWADKSMSLKSLPIFYTSTKQMTKDEAFQMVDDVKRRLARGEYPNVLFTNLASPKLLGGATDIHSVPIYKVEDLANGGYKLYVWDVNFYAEDLMKDPNYLEVRPDGEVLYEKWLESWREDIDPRLTMIVSKVQIGPYYEREMIKAMNSLSKACDEKTGLCKLRLRLGTKKKNQKGQVEYPRFVWRNL